MNRVNIFSLAAAVGAVGVTAPVPRQGRKVYYDPGSQPQSPIDSSRPGVGTTAKVAVVSRQLRRKSEREARKQCR